MARHRQSRRGLVLLLVLTLLTLFALMAVTFVVITGAYEDSSKAHAKIRLKGDPPHKICDRVIYDLLRDTLDPFSPLRGHSLLLDMYGMDFRVGSVIAGNDYRLKSERALPDTGNQFVQYRFLPLVTSPSVDEIDGFYEGCVITFTSGPATNLSSRIVNYEHREADMVPEKNVIRFMVPKSDQGISVFPGNNAEFIINGRPFNGTGFGYDSSTGVLSAPAAGQPPIALLPNSAANGPTGQLGSGNFAAYLGNANGGDADESYDAPDFQNMVLAAIIPNPSDPSGNIGFVIPSYHRPALINYWMNQWASTPPTIPVPDALRQIALRPLPTDHPQFTGSNAGHIGFSQPETSPGSGDFTPLLNALINGPWDVDNDGDGFYDSIWVDPNYPVMSDASGRTYKPLIAVLCLDLDGRLNVNAHGNRWHIPSVTPQPSAEPVAGGGTTGGVAGGPGHGPPAITLAALGINEGQYNNLLTGRNGPDGFPGYGVGVGPLLAYGSMYEPNNHFFIWQPSSYGSPSDPRDRLAFGIDHFGQPIWERDPEGAGGGDLRANMPYELDHSPDAPRGLGGRDSLYMYAELERVMRNPDADVYSLPDRLARLLPPVGNTNVQPNISRIVTTDSYDLPVPSARLTPDMQQMVQNMTANPSGPSRAFHVIDLLRFRIMNDASYDPTMIDMDAEIAKMLPFDLRRGLRWDVNMPFGNGEDENGNGIVDEHGWRNLPGDPIVLEATGGDVLRSAGFGPIVPNLTGASTPPVSPPLAPGVPFNYTNQINVNTIGNPLSGGANFNDWLLTRHLYARYLYVLAMTLTDPGAPIPQFGYNGNYADPNSAALRARGFAQWAINVVDFRDADSICTPFEYDINPFNGWAVDGILGSADDNNPERGLVWGCERPELLITETIAWHDRRTEDRNDDPSNMDIAGGDMHYDQRLCPRGAFFVELYNPWTSPSLGAPPIRDRDGDGTVDEFIGTGPIELYRNGPAPNFVSGVNLNVVSGPANTPVWRLLVVDGDSNNPSVDPDDLNPTGTPYNPNDAERGIYFADPRTLIGGVAAGHGRQRYWSSNTGNTQMAPVPPGRYAVVGGYHYVTGGGLYRTPVGRLDDATITDGALQTGNTRRIELNPDPEPGNNSVAVLNNNGNEPNPADIRPPIAVVVDLALEDRGNPTTSPPVIRPLSISEPLNGYPAVVGGSTWSGGDPIVPSPDGTDNAQYEDPGTGMVRPINDPLDHRRVNGNLPGESAPEQGMQWEALLESGTTQAFRTVLLQRLANPLAGWHATRNPYLTIDRATVDLTAFNGLGEDSADPSVGNAFNDDPQVMFRAHQRGGDSDRAPTSPDRILWAREPARAMTPSIPETAPVPHQFPYDLRHTFGYLNERYQPFFDNAAAAGYPHPYTGSGSFYRGAPNTVAGAGGRAVAFPWLAWNNRPFVSQMELMQVPYTRTSQLTTRYSFALGGVPYNQPAQFSHLLNFFQSSSNPNQAAQLYRLFEYTHVPSKFVSSNTILNPGWFTANDMPDGMGGTVANPWHSDSGAGTNQYHPPYNKVSNFRDPGRININTVFNDRVWQAIFVEGMGPQFAPGPNFNQWIDSRRGYGASGIAVFDPNTPTFFANPLRTPGAGRLVPLPQMVRDDVECTLLRSGDTASNPIPATSPLFEADFTVPVPRPYADTSRNPYFRGVTLNRLSNLVTCRSNVYAIWVTVGYFEVDPATGQLGRELGSDSGRVERHRGFYIIDRSIPVAFQPGVNHNVDRAIRLRRFIE